MKKKTLKYSLLMVDHLIKLYLLFCKVHRKYDRETFRISSEKRWQNMKEAAEPGGRIFIQGTCLSILCAGPHGKDKDEENRLCTRSERKGQGGGQSKERGGKD